MPFFTLLVLLILLPRIAGAAQAPPALTADEAVSLAVRNNPRLSAAARDVLAARHGVRSASALANPELTFTPAITENGSDEEVLLQQPLELNGTRRARTGSAGASLRQAEAEAVVALRSLVFDTRLAYYELVRAQAQHMLAADLLASAEEIDRVTARQVEIGSRPGIDRNQTGIEAVRARQQVTLAGSRLASAQAALNTLICRALAEPIGPLPAVPAIGAIPGEDYALKQALANRAEIAAEEAAAEGYRQEARLARAQGRPDLVPQFRAGRVTRGVSDTGIGIGVTLPLFDYGSRRGRIEQAEESARAQTDRAEAMRAQVRQEVMQALAGLSAADAVVREYEGGLLNQARRLLDAHRTGFEVGKTDVVTLLEAQRTYRTVHAEYNDAVVARAQAHAELERATGAVPAAMLQETRILEGRNR